MTKNHKLTIAGFGGQGVMMIGQILAYAGSDEDLNSLWYPSYGPETRGGTANCSVIISSEYINSPVFSKADTVIVLNKPSLDKFINKVSDDGYLLYNSSLINEEFDKNNIYGIPCNDIAQELGNPKVLNMVMLGAFLELSNLFSDEVIFKVLEKILGESKKHLIEINKEAINKGKDVIKKIRR